MCLKLDRKRRQMNVSMHHDSKRFSREAFCLSYNKLKHTSIEIRQRCIVHPAAILIDKEADLNNVHNSCRPSLSIIILN